VSSGDILEIQLFEVEAGDEVRSAKVVNGEQLEMGQGGEM